MSRWIDALIAPLIPSFGGFVTFCEDPDGLLESPDVREALRSHRMVLSDWDGTPETLLQWTSVPDDSMPLVLVRDATKRRLADVSVPDNRWESVSVGGLMPRFSSDVVKAVPTSMWDRLMVLHDQERYKRPPQETAILIGRALYGVDPEFLKHGSGWHQLLLFVAVNREGLPIPIAKAINDSVATPLFFGSASVVSALTEPPVARELILALDGQPGHPAILSQAERILIDSLRVDVSHSEITPQISFDLITEWERLSKTTEGVLEFGHLYANALDQTIPTEDRLCVNRKFTDWLKTNYGLLQSAPNPAILRLPTLLRQLDNEAKGKRLLLIVIDALSLHAWNQVKARWTDDGIIQSARTRSAFAVLPTITMLSRRSIFEEKLPVSFSTQEHSQSLERKLWKDRFGTEGDYFKVGEDSGISDSMALGKTRVCIMDVSWDKMAHSIDPKFSSIGDSARTWAGSTPLRESIKRGLESGYRVILTADHGQIECYGKGRQSMGVLPEERSKRVVLFNDETICRSYQTDWSKSFTPTGSPKGSFALFAVDFYSFDLVGAGSVSHGGLTIDEVLVPVAEVF